MRLRVEVIITQGTSATRAAMHATTTIPIVMSYTPFAVEQGFVASRARPGGNVTGISVVDPALVGKQLEMLKAAVPNLTRITVQGSTNKPREWLRLTIDPRTEGVFSWENVVYCDDTTCPN